MIKVFTIKNPYNPQDIDVTEYSESVSLGEVGKQYINQPWLCLAYVDEKQYYPLQEEWKDIVLNEGDVVYFLPRVGGETVSIVYAVVSLIIAVAAYVLAPDPPDVKRNDLGDADPVFNLTGEKNQIRLNQPIEDGYGRVRLWPSVAALSWNEYVTNEQYLYQLLCLGQGSWDVEQVYIEDTPIENFQDTSYEILDPGDAITLFRELVVTSSEVGRTELFGPNEAAYTGYTGPFVINEVGTKVDKIQWDLEFPQGCYTNTGSIGSINVTADLEYRQIDNEGNPLTAWTVLNFDQTLAEISPQRFTVNASVAEGRYETRVKRTSNKNTASTAVNLLQWTGLRGFLTSTNDYGDVTLLAIKARATNNLNEQSSQRFNVIATRKLPVYDGSSIPAVTDRINRIQTRNPVWAFVQQFRALYGGNLEDEYIDLDSLKVEADSLEASGIQFDYVFDQKSTVWEAAKIPAFVARAVPILNSSRVSWVRDTGSTFPTFFINPENTVKNSFSLQKRLYDLNAEDGLEVEYKDQETWKNETVLCVLGTQLGINPKKTVIKGVQDRQRAFELGTYQWGKETYERQLITLKTGLEGYIPSYGDVIRIASDIPRWGESGYLLNIDGSVLTLSENVVFQDGVAHYIAIRGKQGQELGPYLCTERIAKNEVDIDGTIPAGETFLDYYREPPYFIFGVSNYVGRICRIVDIQPEEDTISVKAVVDDQRRLDYPGSAPDRGTTQNGYPGTVTFTLAPGGYVQSAYPLSITITKQNSLSTVRYSKTSMPQSLSDGTEYTVPVSLSAGETLYARAFLTETFGGLGVEGLYFIVPNLDFSYEENSQYIPTM